MNRFAPRVALHHESFCNRNITNEKGDRKISSTNRPIHHTNPRASALSILGEAAAGGVAGEVVEEG